MLGIKNQTIFVGQNMDEYYNAWSVISLPKFFLKKSFSLPTYDVFFESSGIVNINLNSKRE